MVKCIYCGTEHNLSESDIIPDALTNARILNKNVCKTEHNNRFSDLFEYKIISQLAFITNLLDIKSSKSQSYQKYKVTYNIDGLKYLVKTSSETQLFRGRKLKDKDGMYLMGLPGDLNKIGKDTNTMEIVDINNLEIEEEIQIDMGVFYSQEMFRMVSKIAYEWYCLKNDIRDKYNDFTNIINFITEGIGEPVNVIESSEIAKCFRRNVMFASHCIVGYLSQDSNVYVLLSLFGIAVYKVKVCKFNPQLCQNNFMMQELTITGERKEILYKDLDDMMSSIQKDTIYIGKNSYNSTIRIVDGINPQSKIFLMTVYQLIENEQVKETRRLSECGRDIISDNLRYLMSRGVIHKKALKRFAKEYIIDLGDIIINPKGTNCKIFFMFYIVYLIGKHMDKIERIQQIIHLIQKKLGKRNNIYVIDDDLCSKLKEKILNDKAYQVILTKGAKIIMDWK